MPLLGKNEKVDLIVSWLTISIAFSFLFGDGLFNIASTIVLLPVSLIAVGTGFVFHELAHRQVARMFKAHAEYRAWSLGLMFALVSAFFGFLFAAPGAVYIYGPHITRRQNGIISAAGPATNIVVAFVFMLLTVLFSWNQTLGTIFMFIAQINFFLALFNLLPVGPLDGKKVMLWEPWIWGVMFATAGIGVFFFRAILAFFGVAA
ncbi:MAG: site-2 protease family protein [Candidatus Diapherotrites archaeon]